MSRGGARRGLWSAGLSVCMAVTPFAAAQPAPPASPAAAPAPASPAADADAAQQADQHFLRGKALLREGKKKEALAAYRAAWALKKSYDVAGNLGSLEVELGLYRDAAEHLSFAVRHYAATGTTAQQLERAKQRLAEARKHVAGVTVRVNVAGAEVLVDGRSVGQAPLEGEVFVEAGERVFEAQLAGHRGASATVEAVKGGAGEVALRLEALPVKEGAKGPGPGGAGPGARGGVEGGLAGGPVEGGAPRGRSVVPAIVIGGVGAVALVGGLVMIGVAESKRSIAEGLAEETGRGCPVGAAAPQGKCAELADAASSADTFGNVGIGGLVVAGVAGVAVAAYLLWPSPRESAAAGRVRVAPVVGARGGAVVVGGAF